MLHTGQSMKSKLKIIDHKNIISWSKLVEPAAPFLNVDFPLLHIKCALGSQWSFHFLYYVTCDPLYVYVCV